MKIKGVVDGIRTWLTLGRKSYCPTWLLPKFEYREVITRSLATKIGEYYAKSRGRWKAIDFDDLDPMLTTAKNYLDIYSEDLYWLLEVLDYAHILHKKRGATSHFTRISSGKSTKYLFNLVLGRSFAKNPETMTPWFQIRLSSTADKYSYIYQQPIRREMETLIGAALFILLIFTGLRNREAAHLVTTSLKINGKIIDLSKDVMAQVEGAGENAFDLIRPLQKTEAYDSVFETPIPKVAATAFVVLLRVLSYSREQVRTNFLFPTGGLKYAGSKVGNLRKIKNFDNLNKYMKQFCDAAGVDYQHPHKCRKSLATLIINHDSKSLEVIRYLLGHKSIAMTMEYIMALPGINDELLAHFEQTEYDKVHEWVKDALDGYVAGPMGDYTLQAIEINIDKWHGDMLPSTMQMLMQSIKDSSISIHRTPAVWCMYFDIKIHHDAPCIDLITKNAMKRGDAVDPKDCYPNPEFCVPYACKYAGHTRSNLSAAKRALRHAEKRAARGGRVRAQYNDQISYWQNIILRLENGYPNLTSIASYLSNL